MYEDGKEIRLTDEELTGLTPREAADKATQKSAKRISEFLTEIRHSDVLDPTADGDFVSDVLLILQYAIEEGFVREGIYISQEKAD